MIDIAALSGGAVMKRINQELQKVAENVLDPLTKAEAVRTVTVTIKIKPDALRQTGPAEILVNSKLAPARSIPAEFVFDFGKDGTAIIEELKANDRDQLMLTDAGQVADDRGNVLN